MMTNTVLNLAKLYSLLPVILMMEAKAIKRLVYAQSFGRGATIAEHKMHMVTMVILIAMGHISKGPRFHAPVAAPFVA